MKNLNIKSRINFISEKIADINEPVIVTLVDFYLFCLFYFRNLFRLIPYFNRTCLIESISVDLKAQNIQLDIKSNADIISQQRNITTKELRRSEDFMIRIIMAYIIIAVIGTYVIFCILLLSVLPQYLIIKSIGFLIIFLFSVMAFHSLKNGVMLKKDFINEPE